LFALVVPNPLLERSLLECVLVIITLLLFGAACYFGEPSVHLVFALLQKAARSLRTLLVAHHTPSIRTRSTYGPRAVSALTSSSSFVGTPTEALALRKMSLTIRQMAFLFSYLLVFNHLDGLFSFK